MSELSETHPASSWSLREILLLSSWVASGCFGDGGGGVGGSTGLGRKARDESTQSPTEVETVAAHRKEIPRVHRHTVNI